MASLSPVEELELVFAQLRGAERFCKAPQKNTADCKFLGLTKPADTSSLVVVNGNLCAAVAFAVSSCGNNVSSALADLDSKKTTNFAYQIKAQVVCLIDAVKANALVDSSPVTREQFAKRLFTPEARASLVSELQASVAALNVVLRDLKLAEIECDVGAESAKHQDKDHTQFQAVLADVSEQQQKGTQHFVLSSSFASFVQRARRSVPLLVRFWQRSAR